MVEPPRFHRNLWCRAQAYIYLNRELPRAAAWPSKHANPGEREFRNPPQHHLEVFIGVPPYKGGLEGT